MKNDDPLSLSQAIKALIATLATACIVILGIYNLVRCLTELNMMYFAQAIISLTVASMGLNSVSKFWISLLKRNS